METQLLDLPQVCLEEIFKKLSFAQISRLGATCKYFREIAKTIFRLYFNTIEETIELEMEKIEIEANKLETLTISEHLHLALLHSVLRILLSEAEMLKTYCWRYMREPKYDFCFPAGLILDEFERILLSVKNKTLKKDMEPEITTTLFHLGETFYDYFDFNIESCFREPSGLEVKITSETNRQTFLPNMCNLVSSLTRERILKDIQKYMRMHKGHQNENSESTFETLCEEKNETTKIYSTGTQIFDSNEKTLFGVKILDILNCCALSNFHTILSHSCNQEGFKLDTYYELRDINVLEALPTIGLSMASSKKQLHKICRYIRNNVRWTNLFHPLQDLWMLEDAVEINRNVGTASALLRQWKIQRNSSKLKLNNTASYIFQYDHRKIISRFKNKFGLLVTASLECPTLENIPLKIEKNLKTQSTRLKEKCRFPECTQECEILSSPLIEGENYLGDENWNNKINTYKFHLELKIQYPSFLSETVKEAILKVDQVGEKTMVSFNEDDIRKSATYRVEENETY